VTAGVEPLKAKLTGTQLSLKRSQPVSPEQMQVLVAGPVEPWQIVGVAQTVGPGELSSTAQGTLAVAALAAVPSLPQQESVAVAGQLVPAASFPAEEQKPWE